MKRFVSSRGGEGGYILMFVLIFLILGSLILVPVMNYTTTALRSQRISEARVLADSTADSCLLEAIWRIIQGIELVPTGDDYVVEEFEIGLSRPGITIKVPGMGNSVWEYFTEDENRGSMIEVIRDLGEDYAPATERFVDPWVGAGEEATFYYVVRLDMPQWRNMGFTFELPLGLQLSPIIMDYSEYPAVSGGPEGANRIGGEVYPEPGVGYHPVPQVDLANIKYYLEGVGDDGLWVQFEPYLIPDGENLVPEGQDRLTVTGDGLETRQKLSWKPGLGTTGRALYVLVFKVSGILEPGMHDLVLGGDLGAFSSTATITSGVYEIVISVEGYQVCAIIALNDDGTFDLISYYIME